MCNKHEQIFDAQIFIIKLRNDSSWRHKYLRGIHWSTKYDLCAHGMRYIIFRVFFSAESISGLCFSQHVKFCEIFWVKFFFEKSNRMIKGCKKIFKREAKHGFNAFFNAEFIECFVFLISYTVPEIIKRTRIKSFYKKSYNQLNIIYFLVNCVSLSFFLTQKNFEKKFIVPDVTVLTLFTLFFSFESFCASCTVLKNNNQDSTS